MSQCNHTEFYEQINNDQNVKRIHERFVDVTKEVKRNKRGGGEKRIKIVNNCMNVFRSKL